MATDEKLTAVVSVRFTEQEVGDLRAMAGGRPVSHLVRELTMKSLRGGAPQSTANPFRVATSPGNVPALITTNTVLPTTPPSRGIAGSAREQLNS